ncbi:radical SAM family heme chaperone HemW [Capillimicrobium parvum]|uniref:Heme chaperone HemW n=1 Tax=Capillimicrobium parvum TaxID=2884022 RepID=A0A9E6Y1W9_9ACTN|nr:radical SAM family heme chaperone HemW [Capillimicrobium parvum]UGS38589.1 Heme chaperone HemW [Capillimicrobium parvum]
MAPAQPDGQPAPADGALPGAALDGLGRQPFGVYLHVPFCLSRCGYCDFNTYTTGDRPAYVEAVLAEIDLAARVLGGRPAGGAQTVFLGGGTPTLLKPAQIGRLLDALDRRLGLAAGAEVTAEANPDTVDAASLRALRAAGVTRISFGVQSVRPHVLAALERRHDGARALDAIAEARAAGFAHVSADLIYGTPGEQPGDWEASLRAVLLAGVDHLSAYGLTVEPGSRLAAQVRRGERPAPDPDTLADRYAAADALLAGHGFHWYELSNWASGPEARCRHNVGYWRSGDWWGLGPGAHSHVGGVRWWNVLRPGDYAERLRTGRSPARAREVLDAPARRLERLLLEVRLADGVDTALAAGPALDRLAARGLLERRGQRAVLTLAGRQLADAVARELA